MRFWEMHESLREALSEGDLSNKFVTWIPYNSSHNVTSHFTNDQWGQIIDTCDNEEEFRKMLDDLEHVSACYLLKDLQTDTLIAFCILFLINSTRNIVCFHGGGWGTSLTASRKYLLGVGLILRSLISQGIRVRTECKISNTRSERFIKAIGFKCYRRDDERIYFYLPKNFKSLSF